MIIIPAILTKTSDEALKQINDLREIAKWLQIDVMDGTMTENSTFDLADLIGELENFKVEIHLMVNNPENYFEVCENLEAKRVYFHLEAVESPLSVLKIMDNYRFEKGLVLSPQTEIEAVFPYVDKIQAVQIMSVFPGKQGQKFIPEMLEKVRNLKKRFSKLWVSVDGGVNLENVVEFAKTGLDGIAIGSALTMAKNKKETFEKFNSLVNL